jgi:16S rRNA (guanine527-N7)-methyltransferase
VRAQRQTPGAELTSGPAAEHLLAAGAAECGLTLGPSERHAFLSYYSEIRRWSEHINITGLVGTEAIIRLGFLDSLVLVSLIPTDACRGIDIGSGAGFPAIPIAITRPNLSLTLVEASRKKASFLRHVVRLLGLDRVEVVSERLERLLERAPKMRESSDIAFARAVAPAEEAASMVLPFLRPGGLFLAQVGSFEEASRHLTSARAPGLEVLRAVQAPPCVGRTGRHVLIMRRASDTGNG